MKPKYSLEDIDYCLSEAQKELGVESSVPGMEGSEDLLLKGNFAEARAVQAFYAQFNEKMETLKPGSVAQQRAEKHLMELATALSQIAQLSYVASVANDKGKWHLEETLADHRLSARQHFEDSVRVVATDLDMQGVNPEALGTAAVNGMKKALAHWRQR